MYCTQKLKLRFLPYPILSATVNLNKTRKLCLSVQVLEGTGVKLRCAEPPLTSKPKDPRDFWDYLMRQGGNWVWEGLADKYRNDDLTWLVERLGKGTIE